MGTTIEYPTISYIHGVADYSATLTQYNSGSCMSNNTTHDQIHPRRVRVQPLWGKPLHVEKFPSFIVKVAFEKHFFMMKPAEPVWPLQGKSPDNDITLGQRNFK